MYMPCYGVNCDSKIKFKKDAAVIFMDSFYLTGQYEKEQYLNYCADAELDPEDNETKEEFVDSYENDIQCWSGLTGLITDYINDHECGHETVFRDEEYILGVLPNIPKDDDAKKDMLTRSQIEKILAKYLGPLLEEPATIDWYDMYEE